MPWGEDIKHCAVKLLTCYPPGAENISKKAIKHLKYDGRSVVDSRAEHLKGFPSLPLGISSMVEGWRIESWMRSDIRMTMMDIVAWILVEWMIDEVGQQIPVSTYRSGSLRECARIFRNKAGLSS